MISILVKIIFRRACKGNFPFLETLLANERNEPRSVENIMYFPRRGKGETVRNVTDLFEDFEWTKALVKK